MIFYIPKTVILLLICNRDCYKDVFQDKLLEHEKVHSEYSFPCNKCSKTFHTNDALKHHLPLHEVGSP